MKKILGILLVLLLVCSTIFSVPLQAAIVVVKLVDNGPDSEKINIVILGDGYTAGQQQNFENDARRLIDGVLNSTCYKHNKTDFNVYAIKVDSNASGAADNPNQPIDNYFGSTFNYMGIPRLLYPVNQARIKQTLIQYTPQYDIGIVLVNSDLYGGSADTYDPDTNDPDTYATVTSSNKDSLNILIHELGHAFAGLNDEYSPCTNYSEAPNMTQINNNATVKWKQFLSISGVGIFQHPGQNWFKPSNNCFMNTFNSDFCPVCIEAHYKRIQQLLPSATIPVTFYPSILSGGWPSFGEKFYIGDFNGDAKDDFLVTADKGLGVDWGGYKVYLSNGSGFDLGTTGEWPSFGEKFYIGDFNGDGKDDFLVTADKGLGVDWGGYKVYLSNGSGFDLGTTGEWPSFGEKFYIGDFNGDGKDDFLVTADKGLGVDWGGYKVYLSNGNGFNLGTTGNWPSFGEKFYIGDFDGGGKDDFLVTADEGLGVDWGGYKVYLSDGNEFGLGTTGGWPSCGEKFHIGDFNGDGKDDFIVTANKKVGVDWGGYKMYLYTGNRFIEGTTGSSPSWGEKLYIGDFNGDYLDDFITTANKDVGVEWGGYKTYLNFYTAFRNFGF